jgi:phage gp36-like protein
MGRGFCDYSCYKVHRDKVTEEVLDKYKVSLEDFTSIICDLWDAGVDTDCY